MEEYWKTRPRPQAEAPAGSQATSTSAAQDADSLREEFRRHREEKRKNNMAEEPWASELNRYLSAEEPDTTEDMDLVEWWQVCPLLRNKYNLSANEHFREQRP